MATVVLKRVCIHDALENSDCLDLYWADEGEVFAVDGAVRRYAGARYRSVRKAGTHEELTYTFPMVSPTDLQSLRDRCGVLQMVRDTRGRKVWGVFYDVRVTEDRVDTNASVTITLEQVSYDEAV